VLLDNLDILTLVVLVEQAAERHGLTELVPVSQPHSVPDVPEVGCPEATALVLETIAHREEEVPVFLIVGKVDAELGVVRGERILLLRVEAWQRNAVRSVTGGDPEREVLEVEDHCRQAVELHEGLTEG